MMKMSRGITNRMGDKRSSRNTATRTSVNLLAKFEYLNPTSGVGGVPMTSEGL